MTRRTQSIPIAAFAALMSAAPALAQTGGTFLLTSSNPVRPATPSTTIEIWAAWDDPQEEFYFAAGDYDLTASDGFFSNPINILNGPGSSAGSVLGNAVTGARQYQLHIFNHFWASGDNPILLASYDWTTTDFTPRTVTLDTSNTTDFIVSDWITGNITQFYPHSFTPGVGGINVVPAPAAWLSIALPLAMTKRHRTQNQSPRRLA